MIVKSCLMFLLMTLIPMTGQPVAHDYVADAKQILSDLAAGHFDAVEKRFTPRMAQALPPGKLGEIWSGLVKQVGPLKKVTGANETEHQGFHVVVVNCEFEKANLDATITFDTSGHIAGLFFRPGKSAVPWAAPAYADLQSFHEESVTVGGGQWALPGTLSLPNGAGPFPAVVLVQGSGPQDEDETIGPNKPFKDLADGLASRKIAVLRYVKRTLKYGREISENMAGFTVNDETVDDARAAVALLAGTPGIDKHHIYVLGHSLGGMMAPRIAEGDSQIAGIIIMAGTTRPLEQVIVDQLKYLAGLNGKPSPQDEQRIEEAEEAAREIESPTLAPTATVKVLGTTTPGSYWLDLRDYHPAQVAAKLKIPILVLQAGKDYQVTREDYEGWKSALEDNPRATFKFYPDLFHLFIPSATTGTGLGTPADYQKAGHVNAAVVGDIAAWITQQTEAMQ